MKTFEEKSRDNYNLKANDYDTTFDGRFTAKFKELLLNEISIETNYRVLDVACGNGTFLNMLSRKFEIQGYGIDISENMIINARMRNPDFTFHICKCENTPFEDESFDLITVCAAFHHFPDITAFAKETTRILKSKGLLYIAEVYYPDILRALLNVFMPFSNAGDVKIYSPKEIQQTIEQQGFKKIEFLKDGHVQIIKMQKL